MISRGDLAHWAPVLLAGCLCASAARAQEASPDQLVARMTAWTRLPRRTIVSVKPDVVVAILRPGVRARGGDIVEDVVLQGESADEAAAQATGWRSMRSEIDVSCATRSNRFRRVMRFSGHNLTGTGQVHAAPGGWIHPTPKAYMFDVIAAVCGPERPGAAPVETARAPTVSPPVRAAQATTPRRATPLAGGDLPEADAPMPAGARPVMAAAPPVRAVAPSAAPAPRRVGADVGVVQIAAFPTAAESEQALGAFARTSLGQTPGLSRRIETARVKGALYYRAVIAGFGSTGQASAFCAAIRKAGGDCFVRP